MGEHVIGQDQYPVLVVQGSVNVAVFKRAVVRSGATMIKMGDGFYSRLAVCRHSAEGGGAGVYLQTCFALLNPRGHDSFPTHH